MYLDIFSLESGFLMHWTTSIMSASSYQSMSGRSVLLCSRNTCKDVFNPNVNAFQSNCAEGLHFSAFHSVCVSVCVCVFPILAPRAIRRTNSSFSDFSAIRV